MTDIDLPIVITKGSRKKKNYSLNLNVYRNLYYGTLNDLKVDFKNLIWDRIKDLPEYKSITLEYTLYPKTRRLCDVANVCSVVDKFFCDALTEAGKIPDDNYTILPQITYRMGKVDPENPRVTVHIQGTENEDQSRSD